ncbi:hypothetical protein QCD58_004595 [Enterobacter hormaechei]|nr:hypothetical protein [Enterobacter hormaechei]
MKANKHRGRYRNPDTCPPTDIKVTPVISTRSPTGYFMTCVVLSAALAGYLTVHPEALRDNRDVQIYTAIRAARHDNPSAPLRSGLPVTVGNIIYPVRPDSWPLPQNAAGTTWAQAAF